MKKIEIDYKNKSCLYFQYLKDGIKNWDPGLTSGLAQPVPKMDFLGFQCSDYI